MMTSLYFDPNWKRVAKAKIDLKTEGAGLNEGTFFCMMCNMEVNPFHFYPADPTQTVDQMLRLMHYVAADREFQCKEGVPNTVEYSIWSPQGIRTGHSVDLTKMMNPTWDVTTGVLVFGYAGHRRAFSMSEEALDMLGVKKPDDKLEPQVAIAANEDRLAKLFERKLEIRTNANPVIIDVADLQAEGFR